jgi:hypothetical protein
MSAMPSQDGINDGSVQNRPRTGPFDIADVNAVASQHPFYSSHKYPLMPTEVAEIASKTLQPVDITIALSRFPITQKHDM